MATAKPIPEPVPELPPAGDFHREPLEGRARLERIESLQGKLLGYPRVAQRLDGTPIAGGFVVRCWADVEPSADGKQLCLRAYPAAAVGATAAKRGTLKPAEILELEAEALTADVLPVDWNEKEAPP